MEYEVKIIDKPFIKDRTRCDRTAVITIKDGTVDRIEEYGYVEISEIEHQITLNNDIILDFCFIDGIKLCNYQIKTFSAKKTFFNGLTDFSNVQFIGETSFERAQFNGQIYFNNAQFSESAIFSYAIFNELADFFNVHFNKKAFFWYATFNGDAVFSDAQFSEGAIFQKECFNSKADFRRVQFNGQADFPLAIFNEESDFSEAKFSGQVNFSWAQFSGEADFSKVQFIGKTNFSVAKFNGEAKFFDTQFGGQADFPVAQFNNQANFSNAEFQNNVSFNNTKQNGNYEISFIGATFHGYLNFISLNCNALILTNCFIEKALNLNNAKINNLSLKNITNLGLIYLDWTVEVKQAIYNEIMQAPNEIRSKTPYIDIAKQYRLLKENYNRIGQYDDEDKAYVEYRRNEAKSKYNFENAPQEDNSKTLTKIKHWIVERWQWLTYPGKWLIADFIGEYGTNPMRILASLVLSIIFFGIVYYLCGAGIENVGTGLGILQKIGTSLYYSAITSFTVGYGDINPTKFGAHQGLVEALSCLEAFFGLFLMAYFTVAFSRKVLR